MLNYINIFLSYSKKLLKFYIFIFFLLINFKSYSITITFDKDGGNGGTDSIEVIKGEKLKPNIEIPAKEGLYFKGYFDQKNCLGNQYYYHYIKNHIGYSWKVWNEEKDTTLYACWNSIPKITLDKQGGVGGTDTIEVPYEGMLLDISDPSKEGYFFDGYYDEKNCLGRLYDGYTKIYNDITLYACWKKKIKINFDKDGGVDGADTAEIRYEGSTLPDIEKPSKEGYFFGGYYDEKNCLGRLYDGYTEIYKDITLYACWKKSKIKITFDKQGGNDGTDSIEAVYNEILPDILNPSKSGYEFKGYYDKKNCLGKRYYSANRYDEHTGKYLGVILDKKQDTTLYACWRFNRITITFDKDGGVGGTDSIDIEYDNYNRNKKLPDIEKPSKEGYFFVGYYDKKNCTGGEIYKVNYHDYDNIKITSDLDYFNKDTDTVLYACWKKSKTKIIFDKHGGNGGTDSIEVLYNRNLPNIEFPTKEGYIFNGYYDKKNCSGNHYYDSNYPSGWNKDTDTVLYACWKKSKIKVTFDKQGGNGGTDSI